MAELRLSVGGLRGVRHYGGRRAVVVIVIVIVVIRAEVSHVNDARKRAGGSAVSRGRVGEEVWVEERRGTQKKEKHTQVLAR